MIFLKKINDFCLYLLVLSVVFEFWNPFDLKGVLSITMVVFFIYIISTLPFLNKRLSFFYLGPYIKPILLFLLIEAISSFLNITYIEELNDLFTTRILKFLFLLLILVNHLISNPTILLYVLKIYTFGIFLLSVLFLFGIGVDIDFTEGESRLIIFGENPNNIGIKAVIGALILLSFILEQKFNIIYKIFMGLMLVPIFPLISATASRGAVFTFFIGAAVMILLLKKNFKVKFLIIILASIVGVLLFNYFLSNEIFYTRFMQFVDEGKTGRNDIWEIAFGFFVDNPFLGVGRSGFKPMMKETFGGAMGAHNAFLEILATTGLIGFIVFMIFYFRLLILAHNNFKRTKTVLIFLLFSAITLHIFKAGGAISSLFVWFVFAILIGSTRMNNHVIN